MHEPSVLNIPTIVHGQERRSHGGVILHCSAAVLIEEISEHVFGDSIKIIGVAILVNKLGELGVLVLHEFLPIAAERPSQFFAHLTFVEREIAPQVGKIGCRRVLIYLHEIWSCFWCLWCHLFLQCFTAIARGRDEPQLLADRTVTVQPTLILHSTLKVSVYVIPDAGDGERN